MPESAGTGRNRRRWKRKGGREYGVEIGIDKDGGVMAKLPKEKKRWN